MKRILQSKSGMSMVLVLCCTALFMALGGIALSASSSALGVANQQMRERRANYAIESSAAVLRGVLETPSALTGALATEIFRLAEAGIDPAIPVTPQEKQQLSIEGFNALFEDETGTSMTAIITIDPEDIAITEVAGIPSIPQIGFPGQREYRAPKDAEAGERRVIMNFTVMFEMTLNQSAEPEETGNAQTSRFFVQCSYEGRKPQILASDDNGTLTLTDGYGWSKKTLGEGVGAHEVDDTGSFTVIGYAPTAEFPPLVEEDPPEEEGEGEGT